MEPSTYAVICPAERHIPVQFQDIYGIVKGTMNISQRQKFEEVCQLIESLYSQEFMALRRSLKQNFLPFSVGAKGQHLTTRVGKTLPPKADLDNKELKLVADMLQLMAMARFHVLTNEEWDAATQHKFMFQLPVDVNWKFFDKRLLSAFWDSSNERRRMRLLLPHFADRCLVFHRGVGVAEERGMYIDGKINLLLDYIVVHPLKKTWSWIKRCLVGSGESKCESKVEQPQSLHRNTKVVERKTLENQMPTIWKVIKNFPRTIRIQEPVFKEVVIVYRTAGPRHKKSKAHKSATQRMTKEDRLSKILKRRNVHVKCFHDIPMADIEAIFPDKKVYIKTLSLITMIASAVMALVAAIGVIWKAGKEIDLNVVWSAGSLVLARCGQVYSNMQAEKSNMIQEMNNILYDKTSDSQEGVVSMMLEDMAEQQLKEAVIAYSLLYMNRDDMFTQEQLDEACEDFLEVNFALKLDFAIEDTLPRLVQWGVVLENKSHVFGTRYQAVSVETAHTKLTQAWARAYEELGKPAKASPRPLVFLLSDPNQELPMLPAVMAKRTKSGRLEGLDTHTEPEDTRSDQKGDRGTPKAAPPPAAPPRATPPLTAGAKGAAPASPAPAATGKAPAAVPVGKDGVPAVGIAKVPKVAESVPQSRQKSSTKLNLGQGTGNNGPPVQKEKSVSFATHATLHQPTSSTPLKVQDKQGSTPAKAAAAKAK
mmetsp:Transcript_25578/g.55720  ORF Transcript_25578/g.55720 Transcript_25578/m.55720 type:complete len:707 (+) Transcript_25578:147-2267(+)|eukprot:CAMPEP_0202920242 /NCGR_PEP_ID=MMETSP1392-20130828/76752_1 /ASSEMBLY_ACC=CAM_ASM_000868 /TAXON_ID=225041 /ORGANISM="Chlamydomonas chlamydogama, Strain SAG 11-48b" /LENGTH=706 /DNA_ID=CAMNT_0049613727 /DNA_START=85 /DNA_END=2205 /DNA_ORIENTATION=-